jgi:transposase InsO family protein
MPDDDRPLLSLTPDALLRYQVISEVRARCLRGQTLARAVRAVAGQEHVTLDGQRADVSVRSVYRWLAAFAEQGMAGLGRVSRRGSERPSEVLRTELLDFFKSERAQDRYASIPELIRRARELQLLGADEAIDRVTVWRACRRMGIPLRRVPSKREVDQRRFAYPHRMMMILADGKHFRAGVGKTKRVALFYLDDASRYGLGAVVGTSETPLLFLRGMYAVVERFGFFDIVFLDRGAGFRAQDSFDVCARLGSNLVLGTARYPEGHGKIERFNQTADAQVLRGFPGAVDVSDDCGALELRLAHWLGRYNETPHEELDGQSPRARWEADARPLRFPESVDELRGRFVVTETRRVSNDNVVSVDGTAYEIPRGHAGTEILIHRRVLSGELCVLSDGRLVRIHPVDLARNAMERRGHPSAPPPDDDHGAPRTAAHLAFARDFGPIVGPDGGFVPPTKGTDHGND